MPTAFILASESEIRKKILLDAGFEFDSHKPLIDEEKLKSEFLGVKKTLLPINSIIRIDEVTELGKSKISKTDVANLAPLSIDFSKKK